MEFEYEIKNEKLNALVEKKAEELHTSVEDVIWSYINRGLVDDGFNDDIFNELHSKKYLFMIDEALGFE